MKELRAVASYLVISAGLGLAASSYAMLAAMFGAVSLPGVIVAIAVAALLCIVVASAIGGLASMYPSAPGLGVYIGKAFGPRLGLGATVLYLTLVLSVISTESAVLAELLKAVAPGGFPSELAGPLLVLAVTAINLAGLQIPQVVQMVVTVSLLGGLFSLSGAVIDREHVVAQLAAAPSPEPTQLIHATAMGVFLYLGFEWVAPLGRRPDHYRRIIPRAMIGAIALMAVIYIAFALALGHAFDSEQIAGRLAPTLLLAEALGGPLAKFVAIALTWLAVFSVYNASLMGAGRLVYALARQGHFPKWCGRVSERTGAPTGAIAAMGGAAALASLIATLVNTRTSTAIYAAGVECILYGVLVHAWLKCRGTTGSASRFQAPFPRAVLVGVALLMPALGLATLFADPLTLVALVVIGAAIALFVAVQTRPAIASPVLTPRAEVSRPPVI